MNYIKASLLTYEQCLEIVVKNDNFYEKKDEIDGFKVSMFDYIVSVYDYFKVPFEGAEYNAFEMRGLTFIHTPEGPKRYLMLHKFFNINENKDNLIQDLAKFKIIGVQEKEDGSMIRPILLPNGRLVCKTKMGFSNDQANIANKLVEKNEKLKSFIKECLSQNQVPLFEVCSPFSKIVINYSSDKLILLQIRDEKTGEYLDIKNHPEVNKYKIETVQNHSHLSFENMLEIQKTETEKEGYIVTLENGHIFKVKTQWYLERHRMMDEASSENNIIQLILEEKLDDAISLLDKADERRIYCEEIQKFLMHLIHSEKEESKKLLALYNGDRKAFAINYIKNPYFKIVANFLDKKLDEQMLINVIKENIKKNCIHLKKTREFLSSKGFNVLNFKKAEEE